MKLLKKLTFALVLAVVFASCSKNDDKNDSDNAVAALVGTWNLTGEKIDGIVQELDDCDLKSTIEFTATKITSTDYEGEDCTEMETETYSYTRNGNTLTVTSDGETMAVEINKLNSTTLEIAHVEESDGSSYSIIETYTKQ